VDKGFADQPLIEARLRTHLGVTFLHLGEPKIAENQLSRARTLFTEHRGAGHPDTLRSFNNLANALSALGRYPEALQLDEQAAAGFRIALGPEHEDTLACLSNLATSYYRSRRFQDALVLFREVFRTQQDKLGDLHAHTLNTMNNLAATLAALAQYDEALKLKEQVVQLRTDKLGRDHSDTLMSMSNLATTYSALGRVRESVKLCEEVLVLRTDKLGRKHPQTMDSITNLAAGYAALDRHADALPLREEARTLQKDQFDSDHPDVLNNLWGIADCLINLNRGAEAIPLIDDCVRRATGKTVDPKLVPEIMELRLLHFENAKDANGCRETAEMWEWLNRTDAPSLIQAARFRAITAAVLRDSSSSMPEQAANEENQAMAWLEKAVAAGYKDAARLKSDEKLAILRNRPDFQRLIVQLESGR
jgi:tetratricopeptide (TPR) repeat protein